MNVGVRGPGKRRLGRRIRLTCRECSATRDVLPGTLRQEMKRRAPGRVTVDWDAGEGTHVCVTCARKEQVASIRRNTVRHRGGRKALRQLGQDVAKWSEAHPEVRLAGLAKSADNRRGRPSSLTPAQEAKRRLGLLPTTVEGTISLCAGCHTIMFTASANARRGDDRGGQVVGSFHGTCLAAWRSSPEMQAWQRARVAAGRSGDPVPPMPTPRRPAHRLSSDHDLAAMYATTVRYFWQLEQSKHADRDEHGVPRSIAWLAKSLNLPRQALYARVQRFLNLLPDESRAAGKVRIWRQVFLTLNSESDGAQAV